MQSLPYSTTLPPNPHLHAILLVTKSHSLGPRLIFHYPPSPSNPVSSIFAPASASPAWYGGASSATETGDGGSDSDWREGSSDEDGDGDGDGGDAGAGDDDNISRSGRGSTKGTGTVVHRGKGHALGVGWGREIEEDLEDDTRDAAGYLNAHTHGDRGDKSGEGRCGPGEDHQKQGAEVEWDKFLGFRVSMLEAMLCPSRAFNKKKFEVGIEGAVFVGAPRFVRDDGLWKKGKKWRKVGRAKKSGQELTSDKESGLDSSTQELEDTDDGEYTSDSHEGSRANVSGFNLGFASPIESEAGSDSRSAASTVAADDDMMMFNVVFVLNPPALEYQQRVRDIYDNVVKKFAKALKYQQARSNYVWNESRRIIATKVKAKENGRRMASLWPTLLLASPLARSIATIFESISASKIAHVQLDANFETSFQIPQAISTPYVSTPTNPQMPGLWLTTANIIDDDEASVTPHLALLLLEDTETLVKQIEGDSKDQPSPLSFYLRNLTPTKSLQKLSVAHSITTQDIEFLASYLVYWRRGRLIPPLHPRNTYIVSPNADMRSLSQAAVIYAARFPAFPSLPKMLNILSGPPRAFGAVIPSKEHRSAYMEILAWLMRGGWVTQLRTFAWIRVTAYIKAEVAGEMLRDGAIPDSGGASGRDDCGKLEYGSEKGLMSSSNGNKQTSPLGKSPRHEKGPLSRLPHTSPSRPVTDSAVTSGHRSIGETSMSPQSRSSGKKLTIPPHLRGPPPLYSNNSSPSLRRAPASTPNPRTKMSSPSPDAQQRSSSASSSQLPNPPASAFTPSLVASPLRAGDIEARWLERIGQTFTDAELRELWPMLLKYFDGRHALEDIALREGMKRKKIAALLGMVRDGGWLVSIRHW